MTIPPNSASIISIYQDLAVLLGAVLVAAVVYILIRTGFRRLGPAKDRGWAILLRRLALPLVLLGVVTLVREVFPVSDKLRASFDAAFLFFVLVLVIRLFDGAVLAWYTEKRKAYPLPNVLRGLLIAVVYLYVLLSILKSMLQVNITPLLTGSAILTAVLGLALQGVLGNILSGMSLHFSRSFERGDWVGIGTFEGVVVDTNWRETRILDRNSNIVVLPNNLVAAERIVNYSKPNPRTALILTVKASPVAPTTEVLAALLEAARDCPQVVTEPDHPRAFITSLDETGISYSLKFWVADYAKKLVIVGEVARLAWYKLRRRGIEVAVSWADRFDGLNEALTAKRERGAEPAAVAGIEEPRGPDQPDKDRVKAVLLASSFLRDQEGEKVGRPLVSEAEIAALAARVKRVPYTRAEVLFRQGEKGTSCFVVAKGRIKGEIVYEEDGKRFSREFEVGPGGLFGEMSLFTGMPRTATGIVAEESELIEIQASDFGPLLARNPELAEGIADIVSARNTQNKDFLLKIKELSAQDVEDGTSRRSVLAYLKRFVHGLLG